MVKYLQRQRLVFLITLSMLVPSMSSAADISLITPVFQALNFFNTYDNYKSYPAMDDPPYVVHKQTITRMRSDPYVGDVVVPVQRNTTVKVLHTYPCKEFTSADESGFACERSDGTWEIMD